MYVIRGLGLLCGFMYKQHILCMYMYMFMCVDKINWKFVHGLMESALYGGRVDNTYDMRVLNSYIHQYFDDSVISGKTGYTQLSRKAGTGLPIGNIPVSYKLKVHTTCNA